jgi:hypothetical protein
VRYGGIFGFAARFCELDGRPIPSLDPNPQKRERKAERGVERWYRFDLPAGTSHLDLDISTDRAAIYLDGEPLPGGESWTLPSDTPVAVRVSDGRLLSMPVAQVFAARRPLGSLTHTALTYYCGLAEYEQTFLLPADWAGRPVVLDLGDVGVAAEVAVNGHPVGKRAWAPYLFDVGPAVKEGINNVRVTVANTLSQIRARGEEERALWDLPVRGPALLDHIPVNGLHGPVRLLRPAE